jgi:GntR family transcriptional regulator
MTAYWRDYAWEEGPMDANEQHVYLYLAERADAAGTCFPSLPTIARATRRHENTVRRAIRDMERDGYLSVARGNGKGNRSVYQLLKRAQQEDPLKGGSKEVKGYKSSVLSKGTKGTNPVPQRVQIEGVKGYKLSETPIPPYKSNRHITVIEPCAQPLKEPPNGNGFDHTEMSVANSLMVEIHIPRSEKLQALIADALRYECERLGEPERAIDSLRSAMASAKGTGVKWFLWFQDQGYLPQKPQNRNGVPIPAAHPSQEKQNADHERARKMWESMSDVYREAHPWKA